MLWPTIEVAAKSIPYLGSSHETNELALLHGRDSFRLT